MNIYIIHTISSVVICVILSYIFWHSSRTFQHIEPDETDSSVWCRGSRQDFTTRLCHFRNLCFAPEFNDFIFFHGPSSIISGETKSQRLEDAVYQPLSMLTSVADLNYAQFDYVDLPSTARPNFNTVTYQESVYFYYRFKPDNLMHVIHDDLLPIFATLQELNLAQVRLAFLDNQLLDTDKRFAFLYKTLTTKNPILRSDFKSNVTYCFIEAYVGVNLDTVWYDYGFSAHQKSMLGHKAISKNTINNFKTIFKERLHIPEIENEPKSNYVVFLLRESTRLILNSMEVKEAIEKVTGWEVVILIEDDVQSSNFDHVISLISRASMMIGMHSAALVLSLFLRPKSILVEMFPFAINPDNYTPYRTLAEINDAVYVNWVNNFEKNTVTHPSRTSNLGGLMELSEEEKTKILTSRTVDRHKCCRDANWLFRIYQDTRVDLDSFSAVLSQALELFWEKSERPTTKSQLIPASVTNVRCAEQNGVFNLSWNPPWNTKFLQNINYKYEVWVQDEHMKSFVTPNVYLLINRSSVVSEFNCWVRVHRWNNKMMWTSCKTSLEQLPNS